MKYLDNSRKYEIIEIMDAREIIKALDNDIRLQMLHWLKEPESEFCEQAKLLPQGISLEDGVCVGCVCEKAGVSASTASHYLDILQRAELVTSTRIGKWTYYRRNEATIQKFAAYVKTEL